MPSRVREARALKLMRSELSQEMFCKLGQAWEQSADLFKKLQAFTCKLYTSSTRPVDINTARHQIFCARRGELESNELPPCENCLIVHTMHANYQAGIWRCSLQQHLQVLSSVKRVWVRNDAHSGMDAGISSSRDSAAAVVVQVQP